MTPYKPEKNSKRMEKTTCTDNLFELEQDLMTNTAMAALQGGTANADEEEWELIYIDGRPVWVRRDSAGRIVEIKTL